MLVDLVSAAQKEDWPELRRVFYKHWLTTCPKVFGISPEQPWDNTAINDKANNENLLVPLVSTFCANSENVETSLIGLNALAGTDPNKSNGQICGHVFKNGELTYTCMDCAQDGTCVMCLTCFESSIHKNHKYRMHPSSGSGYCDCGDPDAWSDGYACTIHAKIDEVCTILPDYLLKRVQEIVVIILNYCISLITHVDDVTLPKSIEVIRDQLNKELTTANQYLTVLYNDETHTYDTVINVLELYIHCSKDQAMLVATIVDREGRSAVKLGSKSDCTKAKDDVQRKTRRENQAARRGMEKSLPLSVKVMDTVLFAHQNHAISLLTWLNSQIDLFPPLREIVGDVMLTSFLAKYEEEENEMKSPMSADSSIEKMEIDDDEKTIDQITEETPKTLLEHLLLKDTQMWKGARSIIHQMLMRTVFMNYEQKVQFAKFFMKNYEKIYLDFINDDHDMDVSIVGLSVQFLTVPGLARRLVAENDAFSIINRAILKQTDKYVKISILVDDGLNRFDFTGRPFPTELKRSLNICRDMAYLLNAVPTENDWTPQLKSQFLLGFKAFLEFLHRLQGMDEVKRQSAEHQVWESEWETAFNILLRIKEAISMIIMWAATNKEVHNEMLLLCVEAMEEHPISSTEENGETHVLVEVDDEKTTVRSFDILKGGISIHQPIPRLIAGLFSASNFVEFFKKTPTNELERKIKEKVTTVGRDFYELNLRVLVLCAQANAQLWRRNGFSLINQIHNYFSPLCRNEMFDRDLLMLQVGAAITETSDFLLHLLHRYRLAQWADSGFEGVIRQNSIAKMDTEDLSKITVILAEEFLHLLILIIAERYAPGIGKCSQMEALEREIIHVLCTGSQTFSHIQLKMSHDVPSKKLSIHEAVNKVADFRKPLATSAGQFFLKEEKLTSYSPFYMHYSKSDQSQAELCQQRVRQKMEKSIRACAPPVAPQFTPFFENILNILKSPILIRILKSVMQRTSKRNRYSSDRLFHKALFLVGMSLNEQQQNPNFNFTGIADETCDLLSAMENLQGKPESSICYMLLDCMIEKYKMLRSQGTGSTISEAKEKETKSSTETAEEAKAKRAAKAAEMRKKAMAKMSNMQSKFMKQMEDDEEKNRKDDASTIVNPEKDSIKSNKNVEFDGKSEYDEDIVRQIGTDFPVCIGPKKWKTEIIKERVLTCILCQEDEPVHPNIGKPMVCAAFIQQSQLFTHKNKEGALMTAITGSISTKDLLTAPATLQYGVDVSTCSHNMHFDCYKSLAETYRSRDSLRARQNNQHNQKMVDSDSGEYQCPLCKRLSNAAIPILPAYQLTQVQGFSSVTGANEEKFEEWFLRVKRNLDSPCGSETVRKKGHSRKRSHSERSLLDLEKQVNSQMEKAKDDESNSSAGLLSFGSVSTLSDVHPEAISVSNPSQSIMSNASHEGVDETQEFYNELAAMLLDSDSTVASPTNTPETTPIGGATPRSSDSTPIGDAKKPLSSQIQHALTNLVRPFPALMNSNKLCGNGMELYEESIKELGKNMIKFRRRGNEMKTKFIEKHLRGYAIATVTWQSTAHVARAISAYLVYDNKPLFGALNTRQRDCLSAMARLCANLSHNLQFLLHAVADMLRILCCEPPKPKLPNITQTPTSPGLLVSSLMFPVSSTSPSSSSHQAGPSSLSSSTQNTAALQSTTSNFAYLIQLFNPSGPRKNANLNILQVDILSLAVSLMMSIGWTWNNGSQSMIAPKSQKPRQLLPDGSVDEAYVLRISLIAHYFQIIATYDENDGEDVNMLDADESSNIESSLGRLISKLFQLCRPDDTPPRKLNVLYKKLEEGAQGLLRPIALIYHFMTLVDPPEALKDPSINSLEALFRYLSLPSKIEEQISGSLVENLFSMWSNAIPSDPKLKDELVVQPVKPNLLVDLPLKYSQLINEVSTFRCPSIPIEESTSNVPTICLVCGQVLCSQAYCCQKIINKQPYGACRYHMSQCSGSVGIFLRVRDCNLVLMTTRKRGCFRPAPYVDEFGEVDQGFRRGNPLHLNPELYQKLKTLWLQQGITEEVVNYNDIDFRNAQYDWAHF